jgi:hypothetical protein
VRKAEGKVPLNPPNLQILAAVGEFGGRKTVKINFYLDIPLKTN